MQTLYRSKYPKQFEGVWPALPTPYTADGQVDYAKLRRLVTFYQRCGVNGLFALGSSAQANVLDPAERRNIAETVFDVVGNSLPVIVHVGSVPGDDPRIAADLTIHAINCGAAGIATLPPLNRQGATPQSDLAFYRVVDQTISAAIRQVPFLLYLRSDMLDDLNPQQFLRLLAELENFAGAKCVMSRFDLVTVLGYYSENLTIITGVDEMAAAAFAQSADAIVGTTINCFAPEFVAMYRAYQAGDNATVKRIQQGITVVINAMHDYDVVPAACARILGARGLPVGELREGGQNSHLGAKFNRVVPEPAWDAIWGLCQDLGLSSPYAPDLLKAG